MAQVKDIEYLKDLASNSTEAYRVLFIKYYPKLKYFIAHLIKSDTVAEDLSQDIFLKVWMMRKEMASIESFSGYLFQMAKNTVYAYIKKQTDSLPIEEVTNIISDHSSVEDELQLKELEELILKSIANMPTQRATIFRLSRMEGLKNEEIAQKLKLTKKTVENHLYLALKDLKRTLLMILLLLLIY